MSAQPGRFNSLAMLKSTDFGIYLDGGDLGEILMPLKYVPENAAVGDMIGCFVYYDSADRVIATTENPAVQVGECAYLSCVAVTKFGAFLDWGLAKDLLVPFREQNLPMQEGKKYAVFVYLDAVSNRIVASAKLEKYLNRHKPDFEEGDEVALLIARKTDMGFLAIINHTHTGLIYENEVFTPIQPGDRMKGYIAKLRPDGKTDLRLQKTGYKALQGEEGKVLEVIRKHGGSLAVTDKSNPEEIYHLFGMSKKNWKKIIGALYKQKIIELHETYICVSSDK